MLSALLVILGLALVLYVLFLIIGDFVEGPPLKVIGLLLGIFLLIFALKRLGFSIP